MCRGPHICEVLMIVSDSDPSLAPISLGADHVQCLLTPVMYPPGPVEHTPYYSDILPPSFGSHRAQGLGAVTL